VHAEVITTGDELVRGDIQDTNAHFFAQELTARGFQVLGLGAVGDHAGDIEAALLRAAGRSRVALVSGGLGPTSDDLTAEVAARAAGVGLELDAPSLEHIQKRFAARGIAFTENNRKQAMFPAGARVLPNPIGTAPGFALRLGGCDLFFFPGVPRELLRMFADHVAPELDRISGQVFRRRTVRCFGLGESLIDARLQGMMDDPALAGATLHYRLSYPEVLVSVASRAADAAHAEAVAAAGEALIRERVGAPAYGDLERGLPEELSGLLRPRKATVTFAESCTAGLASHLVGRVPGASEYLLGGVVAYANEVKMKVLGVPEATLVAHGAVSEPTARAMAEGVRERLGSTFGVSITGIAGPTGGTAQKPVGLVHFAVAGPDGTRHTERRLGGDRAQIQTVAAHWALWLLREALV
jgi:nicotinamide-nucleotide amidase